MKIMIMYFRWQFFPKFKILPWKRWFQTSDGFNDVFFGWAFWQFRIGWYQ